MKQIYFIVLGASSIALLLACNNEQKEKKEPLYEPSVPNVETNVQRGEYLVNTIGCADCHSPKVMGVHGPEIDKNRAFSGYPAGETLPTIANRGVLKDYALFNMSLTAAVGPWGTSFAANITPDDTGIGTWTESQFITAMKKGKYKGQEQGRNLLPPMPWQFYSHLTDDDLIAIFAYLKNQRPVENVVPAPLPPM